MKQLWAYASSLVRERKGKASIKHLPILLRRVIKKELLILAYRSAGRVGRCVWESNPSETAQSDLPAVLKTVGSTGATTPPCLWLYCAIFTLAYDKVDAAIAAMRSHPLGREAVVIGEVQAEPAGRVFLAKLQAATGRACYISMYATPFDVLTADLWQHFYGEERHFPPSYIHVLDVLYEMGIYANVEIIDSPPSRQFQYTSVDEAVESLLERLILPDDEQTRNELRRLLERWLVEREGILVPPVERNMVSTIIWWTV